MQWRGRVDPTYMAGLLEAPEAEVLEALANAGHIFQDPVERKYLESVIHPLVKEELEKRVAKLSRENHPFIIVEVPLRPEA